jgi:sulfur transfer protein SufE
MYTIAGWVVVAVVEGKTAAEVTSKDADTFFNSLKLTEEAKKIFNEVKR